MISAEERLRQLGDSPRDQIEKIKIRMNKLMAKPYGELSKGAKDRIEEYRRDIDNLARKCNYKELTYLEELRKEVEEFCLLEDMRGWDKPEAKKSDSLYFVPYGAKIEFDPSNFCGGIIYNPKYAGKITAISA